MTLDVHWPVAPAVPVLARPQRTARATLTPEEKAERQREANRRSYRKHRERRLAERSVRLRARRASDPEFRAMELARNKAYKRTPAAVAKKRVQDYFASLRRRYGITRADYDALLEIQKGRCAVCRLPFKRKPSVDHDHETGKVRGILCQPCNTVEGLIRKAGLTPRQYSALLKWYLEDPPMGALASKAASHGR